MKTLPDGIRINQLPVESLIRAGFDADFFTASRIIGMPSWASTEFYDIVGKVSDSDTEQMRRLSAFGPLKMPATRAMVREILANRFQLRAHTENREGPVYELVVAKNGPKLNPATPCDIYFSGAKASDGRPLPPCGRFGDPNGGRIIAQSQPLQMLVDLLSGNATGRVVVDKTGLSGNYDFTLTWTPELSAPGRGGSADPSGPSIFTALQEQLGLKLVPAKGPIKTLVIDHIERPDAN